MRVLASVLMLALLAGNPVLTAMAAPISEICYSAEQTYQSATPPDALTRYQCPVAGNLTLAELAQRNYRIVRLTPTSASGGLSVRAQLVVQIELRIHKNGFEQ